MKREHCNFNSEAALIMKAKGPGVPSRETENRIYIHSGNKSLPYFQTPPAFSGGQRGIYLFERRIAESGELTAHTFDDHMFLLPVGVSAVPFQSVLNGHRLRGRIEPWRFRFLAAGDCLSTSWSAPMDSILIGIHPNTLQHLLHADPGHARPELVSCLTAHDNQVLMHLTLALQAYLMVGSPAGRMFESSLLSSMAAQLLASYSSGRRGIADRTMLQRWKLARIQEFVHGHLGSAFRLSDVAALVEMSPYQLCRTFRATTGQTLWQYVLECRVHEAMRRVTNHRTLPLAYVAHDCGFESYSQFIAAFRKFTGYLPSEYRRMLGKR